jgi:hypothetical protein
MVLEINDYAISLGEIMNKYKETRKTAHERRIKMKEMNRNEDKLYTYLSINSPFCVSRGH